MTGNIEHPPSLKLWRTGRTLNIERLAICAHFLGIGGETGNEDGAEEKGGVLLGNWGILAGRPETWGRNYQPSASACIDLRLFGSGPKIEKTLARAKIQMENANDNEKDRLQRHGPYARALRLFCLSVSVLSFISAIVMGYCEGRADTTWMVPPLLPAVVVPAFLLLLSTAVLFVCMFVSFHARRNVKTASLTFSLSFMLIVVSFGINYPRLYLHGFKHYAKTVLTADEWRTISRVAHAHIMPGDSLRKPEVIDDDENQRARWAQFTNETQIQKLGQDDTIYVCVPDAQTTEIEIGGSFVGIQRGVVIYSNTNNISPPKDSLNGPPLFFAPDIATFLVSP